MVTRLTRIPAWLWIAAAAAIVGAPLLWWGNTYWIEPPRRVWRIGAEHSPPWQVRVADDVIGGPAIDILNEAARRRGLKLEWVPAMSGAAVALRSGLVDLWPLLSRRPTRGTVVYISNPWLRTSFRLFSRSGQPVRHPRELSGKRLSTPRANLARYLLGASGRDVTVIQEPEEVQAVSSVCRGVADAALVSQDTFSPAELDRLPECAGVQFHVVSPADWMVEFGVGASLRVRGASRIADMLQEEMVGMAEDGSLYGLCLNWRVLGGETRLLQNYTEARRNQALLSGLAAGLLALGVLLLWVALRWRRARREAEAAAGAKSQFLANMSHEIRTPMNGVLGMTSLLLNSEVRGETREAVETIHSSASALLGILDDILDLAKIEAGKMSLHPAPFRPAGMLEETVRLFSARAREKGLSLEYNLSPGVPEWMKGDALRIRQVLQNMVGNAVKFTHEGGVLITGSFEPGRGLLVEVADTGIGVETAQIPRLFEKFTQADEGLDRRHQGTGLGLAISRQLVEMMGGEIGVRSAPGEGSCFWFRLPIAAASPPAPELTPRPDHAPRRKAAPRVLVAEDNLVNRRVAQKLLERLGCRVTLAGDGEEALRHARETQFDLILLDCQMPRLDGLETARRLRLEGTPTPLVALTGHVMAEDREKCLRAGMCDFMSKPVGLEALQRVLQQWVPETVPATPDEESEAAIGSGPAHEAERD
jgi:signal transduction histidine kinase/ActR/RegA family two-component response regulator